MFSEKPTNLVTVNGVLWKIEKSHDSVQIRMPGRAVACCRRSYGTSPHVSAGASPRPTHGLDISRQGVNSNGDGTILSILEAFS